MFVVPSFACDHDHHNHGPLLDDIWARPGDVGKTSAIYFEITNPLAKDEELVAAHTDVASMTEIHKTVVEKGISQMVHIDRLVIPAGQTIHFKPKGLHIMLMGLKQHLKSGDKLFLELSFKHAGIKTYDVTVR